MPDMEANVLQCISCYLNGLSPWAASERKAGREPTVSPAVTIMSGDALCQVHLAERIRRF